LHFPERRSLLAVGAHLKNTFALAKAGQVILSHHIGDLDNLETLSAFEEGIEHYKRIFEIQPELVVYDLHPDYLSTQYALSLKLPKLAIQHHYAHTAAVMAEHNLNGPVIGISLDGTGYGTDSAIWGGEFLLADYFGFERKAHL
jgi:hydrogenase maturation protein HypF